MYIQYFQEFESLVFLVFQLKKLNYEGLIKTAIDFSDALIMGSEKINPDIEKYVYSSKKPVLSYQGTENYVEAYNDFYNSLLIDKED